MWCCLWLILSQSFHKWTNMLKFCYEFIFVIIECINMQISTFCNICHAKREFDVIVMHDMWMMGFATGAFQILQSRKWNQMQSCVLHQNDIKFSFLMTNMTKCWNSNVDTFNNNKYKFIAKLQYVSSLMERLRQN